MNILIVGNFNSSENIFKTQIEISILLQKKKNNTIFVTGKFSPEIEAIFKTNNITTYNLFPKKKIDTDFAKKIEAIIDTNNIEIVQFFSGKASRSILFRKKKEGIKYVTFMGSISLHWYDPTSYLTFLSPKIDKIICVSNFVETHVKNQLFGKNKDKTAQIYEGYSTDWFTDLPSINYETYNIPKEATVVCFVGNHRKVKGTKYFVESSYYLNSTKNIHYVLIGNRTDADEFKKIAENSPIKDNIHFLGVKKNAVPYIKGCDIYVQTSLSEGLCRAICEALSVKKPVIMTNAGGCTELVDKNSGIIVPLKSPKNIGNAISKLSEDKDLQNKLGDNGNLRIKNLFNIEKTADGFNDLYINILN